MSQLKAKQIAGPLTGQAGSAILFDGTKSGWSTDLNTALSLPSGPTSARPQTAAAGHIRHNSETGTVEAFNGTDWINLGISKFSELVDGPGALQAGKAIRVNNAGTGLEYFPVPLSNIVSYRFRVNLSGTNPDPNPANTFANIPDGWTVTLVGAAGLKVTHNLGKTPAGAMYFGLISGSGTAYQSRTIGSAASYVSYDPSNLNELNITTATNTSSGAASGTHFYVQIWFTV